MKRTEYVVAALATCGIILGICPVLKFHEPKRQPWPELCVTGYGFYYGPLPQTVWFSEGTNYYRSELTLTPGTKYRYSELITKMTLKEWIKSALAGCDDAD